MKSYSRGAKEPWLDHHPFCSEIEPACKCSSPPRNHDAYKPRAYYRLICFDKTFFLVEVG